ncbi:MerR family transcriptional regulator [Companilactobacillus huachuanensis]|uniref:MerR family transcriptional regulator n=1 Tax=Companilactobacillus huachuanensis TaxID=2559914 RepID=A0ABW1RIQ6_9LACO|nr:MerR family transcriptional regulator [Companilactobacillus huachuanensis]
MSEYTTGELAKLAQVSVRTIQYYDKKNLLKPSHLYENGKRIYSETDLNKLKLILLLKNLGLSLKAIDEILDSQNSMKVMNLLLEQQLRYLHDQLKTSKNQIKMIEEIRHDLPETDQIKIKDIRDIENVMNNKKSLRKVHMTMLIFGFPLDFIEIGTLVWAIMKGDWLPFIIGMTVVLIGAAGLTMFYFKNTNYICPNCNTEFKPEILGRILG